EVFTRIYEQKATQENARYWCCKSMESIAYYKEIEDSGLRPFYIHIFRDGRDVALSFMRAIVGPKHIYFLAKKWKEEQALSLQLEEHVDKKRFITVRYEDLIHDAASVVRSICDKLGIAYSEKAMDYFHSAESVNTANSGRMWRNVAKPIMSDNHDKFLRELSKEQLMIFERVAGNMLVKLGYKPLYWPDVPAEPFTTEEIEGFRIEDNILKHQILAKADPEELKRREPQEELFRRISARKLKIA
ncbi:MAG TPA: sulfotransferase, partial [Chryseosolibacter sp.]|nr:sulfotransferase [Chryseosolibacter sp.]